MKLDFLLIGAAKSATTSIGALIRSHPQVFFIHEADEQAFFVNEKAYSRGAGWYQSLFSEAASGCLLGASNTFYTMHELYPAAPERIAQFAPDAKLIYSVRDPLSRIASFWLQLRGQGGEAVHYDFNRAVRLDKQRLVDSTNYWNQLKPYRSLFDDRQILVVFFEDFRLRPRLVIQECLEFIGADPSLSIDWAARWRNPSQGKKMSPPWFSRLRTSSAAFRAARNWVPTTLRASLKRRLIFQPIKGSPVLDRAAREWILELLRDDSVRLLEHCGKPTDFWDLESVP